MAVDPSVAVRTASVVFTLSKAAWQLGSSLSRLDQNSKIVHITVKDLAEDVNLLGNGCDLAHAELEEVVSKIETASLSPHGVDSRIWKCLATQVEESSRTIQELELFVKKVREEEPDFIGQVHRQKKLDKSRDQIASVRTKVRRHTHNLRTTLLLIHTISAHIQPGRADQGFAKALDELQDAVEKMQKSSETNLPSRASYAEAIFMQCAREAIVEGRTMYEASQAAESNAGGRETSTSKLRVVEWVTTLESIRRDRQLSHVSDMVSNEPCGLSENKTHANVTDTTSMQQSMQESEAIDAVGEDSDDDLDTDLAKAALSTGTKAFEAKEWGEAESLLQEAFRGLQQLSKRQRAFCDIFDLHYKLAVCAYHTQEAADAEEALMSVLQLPVNSDAQRGCICDATHLLSLLYIRLGQIDRARSECEKTLQARRRLLGKRSDASLESTALMSQIYILLNNRARAKACLAMIPEERKDVVLKIVEESLGTKAEDLDSSSLLTRSISEESVLPVKRPQSAYTEASLRPSMGNRCYGPVSPMISHSPAASPRQSHRRVPSNKGEFDILHSLSAIPSPSADDKSEGGVTEKERVSEDHSADPEAINTVALSLAEYSEVKCKTLSRKEILDRVGCQPRDRIEEAVCDGDHSALVTCFSKKKDFWRSKLRKRVRPERVTALHFAALFGEINMAQRLIDASFDINEVPYGYSTKQTPLKFAVGARQVDMVEFLIENGAKPSEPDTWSTLAGQLMNRSWLVKTISEAEKEQIDYVPKRMVAILRVLLKHGWDVNAPFETSGGTILHQAVTFWTGSYKWDLNLRAAMTSFLCERGADPFKVDAQGKTPYDMASTSGHQDLLLILDQGLQNRGLDYKPAEPVELSDQDYGWRVQTIKYPDGNRKTRTRLGHGFMTSDSP